VRGSTPKELTECRRFFSKPAAPRQRQYEALRAYFVDQLSSTETARRFGYTPGAFRVLCHAFRRDQLPEFFATARPGPQTQPKKTRAQEQIVALRKRNYSVYEISQALKEQGIALGVTAVREVLAQEGFAPLPRRLDEERPARLGPTTEPVADVRAFALDPGEFSTRVGGLFLFIASSNSPRQTRCVRSTPRRSRYVEIQASTDRQRIGFDLLVSGKLCSSCSTQPISPA
jgi:transposase